MLLLDNNSIMGYPVYYHQHNGYLPPTPPYNGWEQQQNHLAKTGFTKSSSSEREDLYNYHHQPLVYPQFPTPPLSVSPSPPPPYSGATQSSPKQPGDSFQIKRLLNLEDPRTEYFTEDHHHHNQQRNLLSAAMRTASVIMKIEDQRVFHVDSTSLTDEDSSFDNNHLIHAEEQHQQEHHHYINHHTSSSSESPRPVAVSTENLFICKWEKCYK